MQRRILGIVILGWALVTWGGRIGLLTGPEGSDLVVWGRIVGSLVVALVAFTVLTLGRGADWLLGLYAAVTIVVWGTSVWSVVTDTTSSTGFVVVHVALAAVSFVLAVLAVRAWRAGGDDPA